MVPQLPTLIIALAFSLLPAADAGLFPKKSSVKHIDSKQFLAALETEQAFVTAFVAPWCGHCQRLVPELIRAANGLHPLVPVYAVDCEDAQNKPLCAEQDVKGFPTVKLFPKGTKMKPIEFSGTRTGSSLFYWTSGAIPFNLKRSQTAKGVQDIARKNPGKVKAVLMNKSNKMPLLWKVLSNKFGDQIVFVNCRDRQGRESVALGFEAGDKKHNVLIYGKHETEPILYDGVMKFSILSDFFDQVLEGNIDVSRTNYDAKQEVFKTPEVENGSDGLEDETAIDESGYGGFNPHEGVDLDELMKMNGGFNPHGADHPGAAGKKPTTPKKPNTSKKANSSSSSSPSSSSVSSSPSAATSSSSSLVASSSATASSDSNAASYEATDSQAESTLKDEL
ncbi:protein disulfide isomerase [Hysterangium stoloniferum]|nr:protein disulfide isomerase [Hysterangium stoloniferum]